MSNIEINISIAKKVLEVVDAGLSHGVGRPEPGHMCVEAAVCYAMGLPHGDEPDCVSPALRSLKIALNDKEWSSKDARAKGLRRLALAQLGSEGFLDDKKFSKGVAEIAIRKSVPLALRAAASIQKDPTHKAKLIEAANRCEAEGTKDSADAAYATAYATANATDASAYATAKAAAKAAAIASTYAADASAYAADTVNAAAYAANSSAKKKTRDKVLSAFAEDVVQLLIKMNAPGCQWLSLTEMDK